MLQFDFEIKLMLINYSFQMGTVLSSFFWGYSLTQVLGGYLSDRIGAERVLLASGLGWGLITFWFHQIVRAISDHDNALHLIVLARVLLGAFQVRKSYLKRSF